MARSYFANVQKYKMEILIFGMDDILVVEEASAEAALMVTCQFASNPELEFFSVKTSAHFLEPVSLFVSWSAWSDIYLPTISATIMAI